MAIAVTPFLSLAGMTGYRKRAVGDAGPYNITGSLVQGRRGGVSPPGCRNKNILSS